MKADSFEDLYALLNVGLKPEINQNILQKALKTNNTLKLTNKELLILREKVRPPTLKRIQDGMLSTCKNNLGIGKALKFLNNFYLFNGLSKFVETNLKKHLNGSNVLNTSELEHLEKM